MTTFVTAVALMQSWVEKAEAQQYTTDLTLGEKGVFITVHSKDDYHMRGRSTWGEIATVPGDAVVYQIEMLNAEMKARERRLAEDHPRHPDNR